MCIGTRGKPRRLGVPGEDQAWVQPLLDDPDLYKGKTLLVVGGGDSAVEAAIALSTPELRNKVILSYRGKAFNRVKAKNRQDLDVAVRQQRVLLLLGSTVAQFGSDGATLKLAEGRSRDIKFQGAFVLIGGDPPLKWLESMGIGYVQKAHGFTRPPTDLLVERLIGRQPDNNKPGLPVSSELSSMFDRSAMPSLSDSLGDEPKAQELSQLRRTGRTRRPSGQVTIMVPKEQFLLHLPEKLHIEGEAHKVSELRR